jgi:hypothetical protein
MRRILVENARRKHARKRGAGMQRHDLDAVQPTARDPEFLRPPRDSPLAKAGAGAEDSLLPGYVGAVPPEGVEPWDWATTCQALTR